VYGGGVVRVVAVMGSYRKGKTIDSLTDEAIAGVRDVDPSAEIDKVVLVDHDIRYCTNCMACMRDDPDKPIARCPIDDDMQALYPTLRYADAYIFATPVNMGAVTAIMKTFLERICYTLARPGRWPIRGCPEPRVSERKRLIILVSSGLIPPLLRRLCDDATSLIRTTCGDSLNARLAGSLYAGAVEKRGVEHYAAAARRLGRRLAR
jgi:FMN-dependent NADH-azoreductase